MKPYYNHAGITIYHGDCRDVIVQYEGQHGVQSFDLLLTDPPYGIGASAGTGKYGREKWTATDTQWDAACPSAETLARLRHITRRQIIWGGNYLQLHPSRNFLVWDKGAGFRGRDFAECEQAWCSWDANAKIFSRDPLAAGDYRGKEHPTEKPTALMLWCLTVGAETPRTVLDAFCGSGSTLVAAKQLHMTAVGIDAEERYCESAARRLSQEVLPLEIGA